MQKEEVVALRVIDIMSDIDKSLKSVYDSKDSSLSSLSSLSSFKSCFEMMKSPEGQRRLVHLICSVLESSDPCSIPVPSAFGSASTNPCSPHPPPPPHDERKEKEDMITNLLHEIHQTHKALSYLRLFQDDALSFFDKWRKSSDAEKEAMTKKIMTVMKQKKRKRDEEEAKEAIELKWLLQAIEEYGNKPSELFSLMYLTQSDSLKHKFCIEVVKSGKCDRVVVDKCKCKSEC